MVPCHRRLQNKLAWGVPLEFAGVLDCRHDGGDDLHFQLWQLFGDLHAHVSHVSHSLELLRVNVTTANILVAIVVIVVNVVAFDC